VGLIAWQRWLCRRRLQCFQGSAWTTRHCPGAASNETSEDASETGLPTCAAKPACSACVTSSRVRSPLFPTFRDTGVLTGYRERYRTDSPFRLRHPLFHQSARISDRRRHGLHGEVANLQITDASEPARLNTGPTCQLIHRCSVGLIANRRAVARLLPTQPWNPHQAGLSL
jgi:hypothetical protein